MIFHKYNQKGDTIVEVLIAAAIAGLVLSGAFTIANKSSLQIRNSQEHSEAQKIAASSIEQLDSMVSANAGLKTVTYLFCSANGATIVPAGYNSSGTEITAITDIDLPGYNRNIADPSCSAGASNRYTKYIERIAPSNNTFRVSILWDGVVGRRQTVSFIYRVAE